MSANFLDHNLALIRTYQPELYAVLEHVSPETVGLEPTRSGDLTFKTGNIYYHSPYNPRKEASRLLTQYTNKRKNDVFIFIKPGLGYAVTGLQEELPAHVIIAEDNLPMLALLLVHIRLPENNRWCILTPFNRAEAREICRTRFNVVFIDKLNIVKLPAGIKAYRDEVDKLQSMISDIFDEAIGEAITLEEFGLVHQENIIRNLPFYCRSSGVAVCRETYKGLPGIVVAAGPSLDNTIEQLSVYRNRAVVIAVDTVYQKLLQYEIIPDLVVSIDPQKDSLLHFLDVPPPRLTILGLTSYYGIADLVREGLLFFSSQHPLSVYLCKSLEDKGTFTTAGGNVSSICLQAALRLGCDPIILVGQDLAFSGMDMHCRGTVYETKKTAEQTKFMSVENYILQELQENRTCTVAGIRSESVYTNHKMTAYKKWFEQYAGTLPVTVINCTYDGARLENILHRDLEEVIREFPAIPELPALPVHKSGRVNLTVLFNNYTRRLTELEHALKPAAHYGAIHELQDDLHAFADIHESLSLAVYSRVFKEIRKNLDMSEAEKAAVYRTGLHDCIWYTKNLLKNVRSYV